MPLLELPTTRTKTEHSTALSPRLLCLDAFRGFTMVWLISQGFGLLHFIGHPVLGPIARQFDHSEWQGMTAWDLVAPFFFFIVGAVMPISFQRRWDSGETWRRSLFHVLRRCALLTLLGCLASSIAVGKPVLDLIDVLPQIAFGYLVAFLVLRKPWTVQLGTALVILLAHWALFQFVSAPGVAGPWARGANIGSYLDHVVFRWSKNSSPYVTINMLPTAANVILGALAGELLMTSLAEARKILILAAAGTSAIASGLALQHWIPVIKKIRTLPYSVDSMGITILVFLLFYWIGDVRKQRRWAKVFQIVGSNSIFIYLFSQIMSGWLCRTGLVFTGWAVGLWGPFGQVMNDWLVISFEIYLCWWLYRRKIFFKL